MAGDLSSVRGMIQEGRALYTALQQTMDGPGENPLAAALAEDLLVKRETDLLDPLPPDQQSGDLEGLYSRLDELVKLTENRLGTGTTAGLKAWLMHIAQVTAQAAKEGGFWGFGGVPVSAKEQEVLHRLRQTLYPED
jgi:hypothetical protein